MDYYMLLLLAIYIVVVIGVLFISKKYGFKLPLSLGIIALIVSIYFLFTKPSPSLIYEEPIKNALNQIGLYLGLLFAIAFFGSAFYLYRRKNLKS